MTHEAEQERMAAHRREWDKQSIYLRLQEGIPAAFWEKARYLRDEVLAKLPAGEHYDLHLSYLRLLLGDPPGSAT